MNDVSTSANTLEIVPDFGRYFRFEDFLQFVRDELDRPRLEAVQGERARVDAYQASLRSTVYPALQRFLLDMKNLGRLEPIPNGEGRSIRLLHAWNGILASIADEDNQTGMWRTICQKFAHRLLFSPVYECAKAFGAEMTDEAARVHYEKLLKSVNRGDIPWYVAGQETCFVTGDELYCDVSGWKIRFGDLEGREFVPMSSLERPAVIELEIELRTGNLIVADWIRIKQFTDRVDAGKWERRSLNAEMGREENTLHYAREFGFVSASIRGCMPRLLDYAGTLVVASVCSDEFEEVGPEALALPGAAAPEVYPRIDTEYRGVTLIERERLIDLIAEDLGRGEAEREVDRYIAGHDIITLSIEPGTWYFYFSGDYNGFGERFRPKDFSLLAGLEAFCVLSSRQLDIENKQEVSASRSDAPAP